ncbi:TonB-dependent receptor plug domain-containing protein [Aureibaculum sp. A20]|uniref:TonB-dependent receptor plug domain-containing protein n=1 Tax=Aureibaculum flavum TaxID=2795986 RepID=A0ABS0WW46_9FLAO|nr:alpha-2-macroglobulin family protein [Aureibaculum flavum]MBJ2176121.1 TonB-dependent receptor plug domain-containing protein [Aureibaculum flavum]
MVSTKKYSNTIIFCIALLMMLSFKATENNQKNTIEKVYAQTDRTFYFPGETLWFKAYVIDAENKITAYSDVLTAELISPKGSVVSKLKLEINQGYAYGDFNISNDWSGGVYTLKLYTNWMRNFGEEALFKKKITVQKVVKPNLLLNLKFQKEGYGSGSEVIADFEVKDLKNQPLKNHNILFDVMVSGKSFLTKKINTDNDGKANPTFQLPDTLETSDVLLNVQIPYQGSTESIARSVPVVLDNIDLQFFPESGQILIDNENNIAFKALNEFGKPVDVSGEIVDEKGIKVANFSSYHDGMGSFQLSTRTNNYYAKITAPFKSSKRITLPMSIVKGVKFSVTTEKKHTIVNLVSTLDENLSLEVQNNNKLLLTKKIGSKSQIIKVNTKDYPMGISKFSIKDKYGNIIAERLVFINKDQELNVDITLDKESYQTRERVKVKLKTTDKNNNPIPSNLSIAVADNKLISLADDKQDHMLSYLLMSSELKGKIYKPIFYFDKEELKADKALDYVMLTHGWRTYTEVTFENAKFKPEKQSIESGIVTLKNGKPVKAHLLLFDMIGNEVGVFDTDEKGQYSFKKQGGITYVLLAYTDDQRHVLINNQKSTTANFSSEATSTIIDVDDEQKQQFIGNENPIKKTIQQKAEISDIMLASDSALDEVVVIGYGVMKKSNLTGSVAIINSKGLAENGDLVKVLQGKVSGVEVANTQIYGVTGATGNISIRGSRSVSGNGEPLFILDGTVVENVAAIAADNIESVTVLKDVSATVLYGSRGANGVIVMRSKNRKINNYGKKSLNNIKYNNYSVATFYPQKSRNFNKRSAFYMPKYDSKELSEERSDFRQTIYWNPVVQTDENGEAEFEFYNSDAITSFKITAEGIGANGLIGRQEKFFSTKKLLNVDFKVPAYLTVNDTVVLPITVRNESDQILTVKLDINFPKGIKLLTDFNTSISVDAASSSIVNVKIIPIEKSEEETITVTVKSKNLNDVLDKKIAIVSPYFPTEVSMSGTKNQTFDFDVNHVVPNTILANFTIYTDIVGDVMDGIESIIRQPYGCFEQVSSSTYPNILVLKYLQETGKNNPEIEDKALGYIEDGYKKLIAYETSQGGFEWFGKTPPHETLTAYGILEFNEMKAVYPNVDQKMIERTVEWLISRKDGKGGFKKSDLGYDSFAKSLIEVANAYIVYALSESGVSVDIIKEFDKAYTEAIKSEDIYRMALMALTSYNMNKTENATVLTNKIIDQLNKYGFEKLPVENTITRSYGNSKNIETTAFVLLALMKSKDHVDIISQGVEHLVSLRQNGGFGSTQSTSMALKSLIEFTKISKRKMIEQNDPIELIVNGKSFKSDLNIDENGKITIDDFNKHITSGSQKVQVKFSNPEVTFPYSLTIGWDSYLPDSSPETRINLSIQIENKNYKVGDNIRMSVNLENKTNEDVSMPIAIIGIPSGASVQSWQLQEIVDREEVAFYEIFDNYLVLYWRAFAAKENKTIQLDLKSEVAGVYQAPASTAYLYYASEYKYWIGGNKIEIK